MARVDIRPPTPYQYEIDPHFSFGVVGNGSTDDSAALNAALTYAATIGGTVRLRPNTTYAVGATIVVPATANLAGGGVTSRLLATSNIGTIVNAGTVTGRYNSRLRDFSFYVADNVTCDYGLVVDGATGMQLDNIRANYPGNQSGTSGILNVAFYFANTFRMECRHLSSFNHRVQNVCFYFGPGLNASFFDEIYTSHSSPYPVANFLWLDTSGAPSHGNSLNMLCAQGGYFGFKGQRMDYGGNVISGFYSENVVIPMSFGSGGSTVTPATTAITSGSTTCTVSSATNIAYGQAVSGTGIPEFTYVADISGTTVTLTQAATATNASASITFTASTCKGLTVNGGSLGGSDSGHPQFALRTAHVETLSLYGAVFNGIKFDSGASSAAAPVTITPTSGGSGAAAVGRVKASGLLLDVIVTNPGSGYAGGATASVGGAGAATLTPTVANLLISGPPTLKWTASTAYKKWAIRANGSNVYICVTAGTSAGSGGPTGTTTGIADNTVSWDYYCTTTEFNEILLASDTISTIAVSGSNTSFVGPSCPLAVLYDNCAKVSFNSCYVNYGQGNNGAFWPWIARTGTASTGSAIAVHGDQSGIDASGASMTKMTGFAYSHLVTTPNASGIPYQRVFTPASWIG